MFCFRFFACLFSCCFVFVCLGICSWESEGMPSWAGVVVGACFWSWVSEVSYIVTSSVLTRAHKRLCYGLLLLSCVPQDCQRYHLCGVLIVSMWDRPLGFTSSACWEPSSPLPSLFPSFPLLIHSPVNQKCLPWVDTF